MKQLLKILIINSSKILKNLLLKISQKLTPEIPKKHLTNPITFYPVFAFIICWLVFDFPPRLSVVVSIIVHCTISLYNPKYFYRRILKCLLYIFITINTISLKGLTIRCPYFDFILKMQAPDWQVNVCIIVLMIIVIIADIWEMHQ